MTTETKDTIMAHDETDWAMEYAAENRRRVKAERRLAGLACALGGLIKAASDVVDAWAQPENKENMETLIKELGSMTMEQYDAELMANLLTFDPPWGIDEDTRRALAVHQDQRTTTHNRLIREYFDGQKNFFLESYKEAVQEWNLLTKEYDLRDMQEVRTDRQEQFAMQLMLKAIHTSLLAEVVGEIGPHTQKMLKEAIKTASE